MIKKIINFILGFINIKIINKKFSGLIDKRDLIPFQNDSKIYNLYFEGLKKSKNTHTDNFFKQSRHMDLMNLAEIVLKKKLPGDFAECGCWRGHSSYFISKLINQYNKQIKFHIFDSFEGLSENSKNNSELNKLDNKKINKISTQFSSNENFVKNEVLGEFNFVEIYKGWIPDRFHMVKNKKFSLVHIDVDLYEPTLQSLKFFYPRLLNGGIIICDDYNSKIFNGSKKAWDEFFLINNAKINFSPSLGGSFAVK